VGAGLISQGGEESEMLGYFERNIKDGTLESLFPGDGFRLIDSPKLPKLEFKIGRKKYWVSDWRLLNSEGIRCVEQILNEIINYPDTREVSFGVPKELIGSDEIKIICDIVMGMEYGNKCHCGKLLTSGYGIKAGEDERDVAILTFDIVPSTADTAYNYAKTQTTNGGEINFFELIKELCDHEIREAYAAIENMERETDD
jgi:hypothetical protein